MLDQFLEGKLAVLLNKRNQDEIEEFYNIIYPHVLNMKWAFHDKDSALDYLKDFTSGPCHFIAKDMITGCSRSSGRFEGDNPVGLVTATEFISAESHNVIIDEDELNALFI